MKHRITSLGMLLCLVTTTGLAQQPVTAPPPEVPEQSPSDEAVLEMLAGDSASRLEAFKVGAKKLGESPEKFYPAMTACGNDPDVFVRRTAVMWIGQMLVWSPPEGKSQDQRAIKFLVDRSHDEDYRVRYNCVYYGLSTVKNKSDAVTIGCWTSF